MKRTLKKLTVLLLSLAIIAVFLFCAYAYRVTYTYAFSEEKLHDNENTFIVFDGKGEAIETKQYENGYIGLEQIPKPLINAFIAVEDKRFYSHGGIDYIAIARAVKNNLSTLSLSEGASTISQQVIKNSHLSNERTIKRKLIEAKLARKMEKQLSKEQILEAYLNLVYFGKGVYGVKKAAKLFFDKEVSQLSLMQCAIIAGVVKSPVNYSPFYHLDNCIDRAKTVLSLMGAQGYITEEEAQAAREETIIVNPNPNYNSSFNSYVDSALFEAASALNISIKELKNKGYKIYTYMQPEQQQIAAEYAQNEAYLKSNSANATPDCAVILLDNAENAVNAYYNSTYYNAYTLSRQAGSLLKPFSVYAPALDSGLIVSATIIDDEPTTFDGGYSPANYADKYYGKVDVGFAIAHSLNVPAVKLLEALGVDYAKKYLSGFGLATAEDDYLALALGGTTYGYTLPELADSYCALANGGSYTKAAFVKEIRDQNNALVYKRVAEEKQIISNDNAYILTDLLTGSAECGTAKKLSVLPYPVAAKTGTVAAEGGNSDAYCAAYTREHTLIVWQGGVGNDNAVMSDSVSGGSYTAMQATGILREIYSGGAPTPFVAPPTVTPINIDYETNVETGELSILPYYVPQEYGKTYLFSTSNMPHKLSTEYSLPLAADLVCRAEGKSISFTLDTSRHLQYELLISDPFGGFLYVLPFVGNGEIQTFEIKKADVGADFISVNLRCKYLKATYGNVYNVNCGLVFLD